MFSAAAADAAGAGSGRPRAPHARLHRTSTISSKLKHRVSEDIGEKGRRVVALKWNAAFKCALFFPDELWAEIEADPKGDDNADGREAEEDHLSEDDDDDVEEGAAGGQRRTGATAGT